MFNCFGITNEEEKKSHDDKKQKFENYYLIEIDLVLNRSVQINIDYLIINKMVFEMPSD
jgi:hypothetical protein